MGKQNVLKSVEKVWGIEEWIVNNELYCLKKLIVRPGWCCSLHYHNIKDETFWVMIGKLHLEISGKKYILFPGHTTRIPPPARHKFWVPSDLKECVLMEVSTHHDDNDVVRIEQSKLIKEDT